MLKEDFVPESYLPPESHLEAIRKFMRSGVINIFIIEGPNRDIPTKFNTFVLLYESTGASFSPMVVSVGIGTESPSMDVLYNHVLALSIPDRVKQIRLRTNQGMADELKQQMTQGGLPYALIAFAEAAEGPIALLATVQAANPVEVLKEFQNKAEERLTRIN